jgi:signal transduction histidine kinase
MRGAGFKAELRIEGSSRSLPPGLDVTAFRVIQEGLTNTLKHVPGAFAEVLIRYCEEDVLIQVEDDGGGGQPPAVSGEGRGLRGMWERISIYGGQMEAGPLPDRGFRLRVRLPNRPD